MSEHLEPAGRVAVLLGTADPMAPPMAPQPSDYVARNLVTNPQLEFDADGWRNTTSSAITGARVTASTGWFIPAWGIRSFWRVTRTAGTGPVEAWTAVAAVPWVRGRRAQAHMLVRTTRAAEVTLELYIWSDFGEYGLPVATLTTSPHAIHVLSGEVDVPEQINGHPLDGAVLRVATAPVPSGIQVNMTAARVDVADTDPAVRGGYFTGDSPQEVTEDRVVQHYWPTAGGAQPHASVSYRRVIATRAEADLVSARLDRGGDVVAPGVMLPETGTADLVLSGEHAVADGGLCWVIDTSTDARLFTGTVIRERTRWAMRRGKLEASTEVTATDGVDPLRSQVRYGADVAQTAAARLANLMGSAPWLHYTQAPPLASFAEDQARNVWETSLGNHLDALAWSGFYGSWAVQARGNVRVSAPNYVRAVDLVPVHLTDQTAPDGPVPPTAATFPYLVQDAVYVRDPGAVPNTYQITHHGRDSSGNALDTETTYQMSGVSHKVRKWNADATSATAARARLAAGELATHAGPYRNPGLSRAAVDVVRHGLPDMDLLDCLYVTWQGQTRARWVHRVTHTLTASTWRATFDLAPTWEPW